MKRLGLGPVFTALLLILVVSMFMFLIARTEDVAAPSASSSFPSGLGAFAELLRQDGYTVVLDRSEKPYLNSGDLAIAGSINEPGLLSRGPVTPSKTLSALKKHLGANGRVLELRFSPDFIDSSHEAKPVTVINMVEPDHLLKVTSSTTPTTGIGVSEDPPAFDAWTLNGSRFVSVFVTESGVFTSVMSAIGATNRFLGQEDNARFYLGLVSRLATPGGRVVFVEASIGEFDHKGLISTFGSWAVAAQWQFLFLLLVVAYTVSRRFGFPVDETPAQLGSRQLVDAVAQVFRSSKKLEFASHVLAENALDSVRQSLRLAPGTNKQVVLAAAPQAFADAYAKVVMEREKPLPKAEMVAAVRGMQAAATLAKTSV